MYVSGRWMRFTFGHDIATIGGWRLIERKGKQGKPQHPGLPCDQTGPASIPARHGNSSVGGATRRGRLLEGKRMQELGALRTELNPKKPWEKLDHILDFNGS